jgi:hypothetical protein
MLSLGQLFVLLVLAAAGAWLWRGHGVRERALAQVAAHCARLGIELLDGNVAFQRLAIVRDGHGHRRLARVYGFEFTVTGEQRLHGSVQMFGQRAGHIELDPYPFESRSEAPVATLKAVREVEPAVAAPVPNNVVRLQDWRPRPNKLDL